MIEVSNFNQRNQGRYNPTEELFIEFLNFFKKPYRRYGFDETEVRGDKYYHVHPFVRCTPDFICPDNITEFYEIKGGSGQILLKESYIEHYYIWNKIHKLNMFLVDYRTWEYKICTFEDFVFTAQNFSELKLLDKGTRSEKLSYYVTWNNIVGYKRGFVSDFTGIDKLNEIRDRIDEVNKLRMINR